MARAGRLRKPMLTGEAHQALNEALHQLHAYARYPSLSSLETALEGNGVRRASRATIHNAFSSARLPRVDLVDALAVELARQVRNVEEGAIDKVGNIFDNLWFLADLEDRERSRPEEMSSEAGTGDVPDSQMPILPTAELLPVSIQRSVPDVLDVERVTTGRLRTLFPKRTWSLLDKEDLLFACRHAIVTLLV
ncbi:hypothetical protein OHB07_38780 (plasmid) [Streptomyces sp. NBC_00111]|uniref:hypothetical protein n=1 Tax=unclassified Streptomyces TaxID=2593676 RepID=UPI002E34CADD|nr:hypothetical protein [Streptomyces sp. NBC_01460]